MPRISTRVMVDVDKTSCVEFPVEVRYNTADDRGWIEGYITVHSVCHQYSSCYEFVAKVYDASSEYGINEGRISKLCVKDVNSGTATEVIGYDRGWYLKPQCMQDHAALCALLKIFGHC